jgi:uncharacterized protein (DUF1697 family)
MKYVALIRGIGPGNPNMHSAKLKEYFESLGFEKVKPIISSGNIVFESRKTNTKALEERIERELPKKLGFSRTTIVRTEGQLKELISKNPFDGVVDAKPNYLLVTFFKSGKEELATVVNLDKSRTPDFMSKLEKEYGHEITSRTWKTVHRILNAMERSS